MILGDQKPLLGKLPLWAPNPAGIPPPVGAWIMNERSGGRIYDSSGNGYGGIIDGAVWQMGDLYFDALDDYVSTAFYPKNVDCTWFALFATINAGVDEKYFCGIDDDTPLFNAQFGKFQNKLRYFCKDSGGNTMTAAGATLINDGLVHSGAAVVIPTLTTLYLDGISDGTDTDLLAEETSLLPLYIGARNNNGADDSHWSDYLIALYYYSRALTASQIVYLHQHPYYAWEIPELWMYDVGVAAGRTTRNTDAWYLGQRHGQSFRMAA